MKDSRQLKVIVFNEKTGNYNIWVAQCLDFDITAHGEKLEDALYEFDRLFFGQIQAALDAGVTPFKSIPKAPDFFWNLYKKAPLEVKAVDDEFRFRLKKKPPTMPRSIIDAESSARLVFACA